MSITAACLYEVFASYSYPGLRFCGQCYTPEIVSRVTDSPVSALSPDLAEMLLGETADHWENADVYRHYLPRLLEVLGRPWAVKDLYPLHLSETLVALNFHSWPHREREAVIAYLEYLQPEIESDFTEDDRSEWQQGLRRLTNVDPSSETDQNEMDLPDA